VLLICGKSPESGAQVFVFFEAGNINKPVYFAAAQSGPGWFSEHPNQHVFQSDNIRVRIDEEPEHPDSTCKFDTYNDQNSEVSKEDGTKLNRKTRLDIEVLAKDINAVNVQIHGDVNMKIDGDWYVHHEGDKHETHIGDTYIKHIGATYTEEEGPTIFRHVGNYSQLIDGSYSENITVNYNQSIGADSTVEITNNSILVIGGNYNKTICESVNYKIVGSENKSIGENKQLRIGGDCEEYITGYKKSIIGKNLIINVNDDIEQISKRGSITILTQGQFEIFNEQGVISAEGYNNLGTKGNIIIKSTFGNIGITTVENKQIANLEKECCVIPWNPSYLKALTLISQLVPGFDPDMVITDPVAPTDLTSFLQFLQTAVMYDGFPTFLPCKMIMQNPAIEPPTDGWISKFRNIDDNWNEITNTNYWKLISKVVGNIDIKSWSGDITVETKGTLGNAGNINLFANNKYGALPGYKVGNVQVAANTPFRVFTDPRDLFLDTHLLGKLQGKFAWFSNATGQKQGMNPPAITLKPLQPVQQILQMLGVPFEFGFIQKESGGGGCISCINDVIVQAAADLQLFTLVPYVITEKLFLDKSIPMHKFNASTKSMIENEETCAGSVSILKQSSNGFGHAVDKNGLDEIYGSPTYPFGNIIMNGVGSYDLHVGKNATFAADTNNWQFGVSSNIEQGWFYPSKGINPIDNILGEMNVAMPNQVGQPVIKKKTTKYYNHFDKLTFGEYTSIYTGLTDTGVYSIPQVKNGIFGNEQSEYTLDIPNKIEKLNQILQCNSTTYVVDLQPYIINDSIYKQYIELPTGLINELADVNSNLEEGENSSDTDKTDGEFHRESDNYDITFKHEDMKNSFYIQLGKGSIMNITSGLEQECLLKDKMPNTANAISTVISVLGALIKLVPAIGTAIGEFIQQGAKMLPNLLMLEKTEFFAYQSFLYKFFDKKQYSIDIPIKSTTETGIIAWPISGSLAPILSGKPVFYNNINIGLPDILPVADSMVSIGTIIDPLGCLQKMLTEQLPEVINTTEMNTTIGIGGLPKFLKDFTGMEELLSANAGLFPGLNVGAKFNFLDSEDDKKGIYWRINSQLPIPPDIELSVDGEYYTLKCGVKGTLDILPVPDCTLTLDIIDETLAVTVGGPIIPHSVLVVGGKEIWNIPNGGGGLLGNGLIDAITDVFF